MAEPPPIGWFYLRCATTGLVLEETGQEQPLVVNSQAGSDSQLWKFEAKALISKSNFAIDLMGPMDGDWSKGGTIIGWPPHGGENQVWKFEDGQLIDIGGTNFALVLEDNPPRAGSKVIGVPSNGVQGQSWSMSFINHPVMM